MVLFIMPSFYMRVTDETLLGMDGDKAASKLRGPAGTAVKLKVRKEVSHSQIHTALSYPIQEFEDLTMGFVTGCLQSTRSH